MRIIRSGHGELSQESWIRRTNIERIQTENSARYIHVEARANSKPANTYNDLGPNTKSGISALSASNTIKLKECWKVLTANPARRTNVNFVYLIVNTFCWQLDSMIETTS